MLKPSDWHCGVMFDLNFIYAWYTCQKWSGKTDLKTLSDTFGDEQCNLLAMSVNEDVEGRNHISPEEN